MPLHIGDSFAGYRIQRVLGLGGMGEVYLAQHPRLPRQDALKVLRHEVSDDTSFHDRFIREADLAAGLRHPHIVGVLDRGEYNGQLWIAMDWIDGADAATLIQQRYPAGMPTELVIAIVSAVASALDYAHKKGLLHRDVKPANIIVADAGSAEQSVFLADFGIARPLEDTVGITATNMTLGTMAYAAPEQLMGEQIDGRADQYALAATAYHLLTGLQLFPHSNPAVVISRQLNTPPPLLSDRRPDCASLDGVLQMALSKNPSDRFPSCAAFAAALADESSRLGAAPASATTQQAPRPRQPDHVVTPGPRAQPSPNNSRRTWVMLGAAAAVMLLVGTAVLLWRLSQGGTQTATAGAPATTSASVALPTPTAALPSAGLPAAATPSTIPKPAPVPGLVNDEDNCLSCNVPNVTWFKTPSRNINCEMDYQRGSGIPDQVYCASISPRQAVTLNSSGVVTVCSSVSCMGDPPQGEPTLPYNHTTELGPFTCLSEFSGVTCTVGSGKGFAISKSGITPVG